MMQINSLANPLFYLPLNYSAAGGALSTKVKTVNATPHIEKGLRVGQANPFDLEAVQKLLKDFEQEAASASAEKMVEMFKTRVLQNQELMRFLLSEEYDPILDFISQDLDEASSEMRESFKKITADVIDRNGFLKHFVFFPLNIGVVNLSPRIVQEAMKLFRQREELKTSLTNLVLSAIDTEAENIFVVKSQKQALDYLESDSYKEALETKNYGAIGNRALEILQPSIDEMLVKITKTNLSIELMKQLYSDLITGSHEAIKISFEAINQAASVLNTIWSSLAGKDTKHRDPIETNLQGILDTIHAIYEKNEHRVTEAIRNCIVEYVKSKSVIRNRLKNPSKAQSPD